MLPSDAEHKSELGLVKLRVGSAAEVDAIAADFRARLGKPSAGILVQEMAGEGGEVVLSIGSGGVAIELYRDITHLALPVSAEQVRTALRMPKLWTLPQCFRGKPAADVARSAMICDTAGRVTCRRCEARPKCSSSAAAMKQQRWRSSMVPSLRRAR